jgi:hypothetical protein
MCFIRVVLISIGTVVAFGVFEFMSSTSAGARSSKGLSNSRSQYTRLRPSFNKYITAYQHHWIASLQCFTVTYVLHPCCINIHWYCCCFWCLCARSSKGLSNSRSQYTRLRPSFNKYITAYQHIQRINWVLGPAAERPKPSALVRVSIN